MLVQIKIDDVDEDDEILVDGLQDQADGGLAGRIAHYSVGDLDRFFQIYEFTEAEEEDIRARWQDHDLFVYADGAVVWSDGDILVGPGSEFLDIVDFSWEARFCGGRLMR